MSTEVVEYVSASELVSAGHSRGEIRQDNALRYLADTIEEVGIQQPLLVRGPTKPYPIIDGNRRFAAGLMKGITAFPAIQADPNLSDVEALQRSMICNCARLDLSPVDRGQAYHTMMNRFGWTAAEVAKRTRTSAPSISRLTNMLMAPPEILRLVHEGKLAADTAYHIAITTDPEVRARFVQDALDGRLTRDELVKRIRNCAQHKDPARPRRTNRTPRERVTVPLGAGRAITVVGPGLSVDTLITWLDQLLNRIKRINTPGVGLKDLGGLLKGFES